MLRKLMFLLIILLFWIPVKAQDDFKQLELSVNDTKPNVLEYNFCRLSITAAEYEPSSVTININVENTNEAYSIFLFGHAFTEKALKKQKIRFDKKSYGTTSKEILVCEGLDGDNILRIEPNGNRVLTFPNISESIKNVELPIYIAKYEKKKLFRKEKYMIRQRVKLIIDIRLIAADKADNKFEDIKGRYEDLAAKIEANPVCPDRNHPVSKREQAKILNDEIDNLKDNIADIKSENHWRERDEEYKPYKELLEQLDNLKIKEEVCDNCRRSHPGNEYSSRHKCEFCSKSPSEILLLLQRTYQSLDNGIIKKSEALRKIEKAHKAWTGGCRNLKEKTASDSATKYKIDKYYEAIVNY